MKDSRDNWQVEMKGVHVDDSGAQIKEDCAQTKVTVNIRPGPVLPAQKQAWKRFWQKIIAEAKNAG